MMQYRKFTCLIALIFLSGCSHGNTYTVRQAKDHVGHYVTITGKVTEVYQTRKGTTFLDMGGHYPNNPFTAVVFRNSTANLGNLQKYQGRNIRITGTIKTYRGKPEIIVNSKNQIH